MASSENLLPRPPSRGRIIPDAPHSEAVFLSPTKQQPFQRPSSPRIILQPIAAERGPGTASSGADRIYLSSIKNDINSVCRAAEALQRDLEMQRRPVSSLSAKNTLARRPLTPSAAAEPSITFRSDSIEAALSKILSSAELSDGSKPALKIQALELVMQACDDAGKVALALTDRHVGCSGRSDSNLSSSVLSKVGNLCSLLSRVQDLHVLLEGGGTASAPKRAPVDVDGRPPVHPADTGRGLPAAAAAPSAVSTPTAAVACLRLIAASLNQPLQGSRVTCSDFLRQSAQILKDTAAPIPPVTSAPSISALRNEIRGSLGLERLSAGDSGAAAEAESAVKDGSDSIVAAVTAIGDAAAVFPWCISVFELLVGKLRAAAASASSSDSSARKQAELCNEKIGSLETEVSRLKLLLHSRDGELQTALDEVRASREIAAAAKGKEVNDVPAKDLQSLRDDLAAAQSLAAAAAVERDAVKKREVDLLQQFEELKRAFHDATEGAAAAAKVAPELVEKLKKDVETARLNEMSTRGELCLLKEQLEIQEQKLQTLQTQLQAEKQRGERLRREKEDLELANSCMKGEMSTMKRVTVNQDSYEAVLADELCCMREAYEAKLKESAAPLPPSHLTHFHPSHSCSRSHLDREIQSNAAAMRELRETLETENRSLKRRLEFVQAKTDGPA